MRARAVDVRDAYEWCRQYARRPRREFTVVSWFLPKDVRPHFFALYAYCRWTDDLGDEADGDRLALLDAWESDLRACFDGRRQTALFAALGATIDRFDIPADPFLRLIEANRMDQQRHVVRDVRRPAAVLRALGDAGRADGAACARVSRRRAQAARRTRRASACNSRTSGRTCRVDLREGPGVHPGARTCAGSATASTDLRRGVVNDAFRALMRFEVDRARALFAEGRALEDMVDRRARTDVRLFRLGGEAVLDAIERADYDVLSRTAARREGEEGMDGAANGLRMKAGL